MLSLSVNTNNQVTNTGFSYDASGDLTSDGVYTYAWNAEQHLKSAASVTYTYDGDLKRVEKSSGTLYWYSTAGVPLAETDTSGNTLNEYVFFGSARVARRDSSGNVYYYFEDHLGTATTLSNASGVLCYDADFLPFGYESAYVTSCAQNYKFTGLERDGETGLDHTLNRKYDSSLGRWLTPDPKRGNIASPQSLNRYAYVLNNPIASVDPLGLDEGPEPGSAEGGSIGGTGGPGNPNYPCANIVVAGGLRPHIRACGSGSAGGGADPAKRIPQYVKVKGSLTSTLGPQLAAAIKNLSPSCQAFFNSLTGGLAALSGCADKLQFFDATSASASDASLLASAVLTGFGGPADETLYGWIQSQGASAAVLANASGISNGIVIGNVFAVASSGQQATLLIHEASHYAYQMTDAQLWNAAQTFAPGFVPSSSAGDPSGKYTNFLARDCGKN
jgi:RHS repeat-associated protein